MVLVRLPPSGRDMRAWHHERRATILLPLQSVAGQGPTLKCEATGDGRVGGECGYRSDHARGSGSVVRERGAGSADARGGFYIDAGESRATLEGGRGAAGRLGQRGVIVSARHKRSQTLLREAVDGGNGGREGDGARVGLGLGLG